ncbi:MFS transporter [Naasia lichenicola]|uniref:MFS transporter n=2 Tax=Naasia lichenicola TaxID=2565933 RepID=A0A4S4FJ96_9MICO|nr:MFS transporter [Naasia lichenicola]
MFASNGAIFAALLPWYPTISDRLALSASEFGVIVASFAVGAIVSSALPAPLIARFGPVRVAILGTVLLAASIASVGWITEGWMFALSIFFAGFFDAVVDVAQNVAGIRVQDAVRRSILSSMHALWSLGGVLSGALSTAAAAAGWDIRAYLALVALAVIASVAIGGALIGPVASSADRSPGHEAARAAGRSWRVVLVAAMPLVVLAICGTAVEDIANNWAAMAAVDIGGQPVDLAGLGFVVVIGSQCIGRFVGDPLIQCFGRRDVSRFGGVLTAIGGLLVVTAQADSGRLFVGLAFAGYGAATLVPSALTAAATIPGMSEGAGVTIVSWLMRLGFLGTSPLIGVVTDSVGLRWGLCVLVLVGVAAALLAGALESSRSLRR